MTDVFRNGEEVISCQKVSLVVVGGVKQLPRQR